MFTINLKDENIMKNYEEYKYYCDTKDNLSK